MTKVKKKSKLFNPVVILIYTNSKVLIFKFVISVSRGRYLGSGLTLCLQPPADAVFYLPYIWDKKQGGHKEAVSDEQKPG